VKTKPDNIDTDDDNDDDNDDDGDDYDDDDSTKGRTFTTRLIVARSAKAENVLLAARIIPPYG